jgi:outer membrane lipoprotein carrier protein
MRTVFPMAAMAALLLAGAARAAEPEAKPEPKADAKAEPKADAKADAALAEKVQRFYEKTADFSADFEQEYRYVAMTRVEKSQGTVKVKKPGYMRWDYQKPWPRQFVLDGRSLYVYDVEDNAVTVKKDFAADSLSAAVTFLWGRGRLLDEFDVRRVERPELGATVLQLEPKKPQAGFQRVFFGLDGATGAVLVSLVVDSQGNENKVAFKNPKTNTGLAASVFKFEVPKGATVSEMK